MATRRRILKRSQENWVIRRFQGQAPTLTMHRHGCQRITIINKTITDRIGGQAAAPASYVSQIVLECCHYGTGLYAERT